MGGGEKEKLSLAAETHSKGIFFSFGELNMSQAQQEMEKYQKINQVNSTSPRLSKTWLKGEAEMMNPLEPM